MEDVTSVQSQAKLVEAFMTSFNNKKEVLCTSIEALTLADNMNTKLTDIQNQIQNLNKLLHDASLFLPSYSVKIRQNEIRNLEKALKEKELELIPKTKFGFKSKQSNKPDCEILPEIEKLESVTTENVPSLKQAQDSNFVTIENLENTKKTFDARRVSNTDVLLRNLTNVVIELHGSPSTLRISNVQHCKILCGPVLTSVFVESVADSVLYLCCQQLRTHSSKNTDIYLRVLSRAIIEECTGIRFAPYTRDHPLSKELFEAAEIDLNSERFDAVDDFDWLSASHSPNWCIIPDEQRISFS